jgi:RNA polymerase sigma-70 factor (ECF subfamily)
MRSTRSDDGVVVPFTRRTLVRGRCTRHVDRVHLSDLLLRAARRDTGAFMHFYDHTIGAAYRLATAVTPDREAAEDLVRDLYVRAWQHAGEHRWSGLSPVAWLLVPALERRSCFVDRDALPRAEAAAHG